MKVEMDGILEGEHGRGEDLGYGATQTYAGGCSHGYGSGGGSFALGGSRLLAE